MARLRAAQARSRRVVSIGALAAAATLGSTGAATAMPTPAVRAAASGEQHDLVAWRLATPEAAWRALQEGRRRWSDADALTETLAFRARWPGAYRAEADALCIGHALRVGHAGWQRQCWLDGLQRHGWAVGAAEAATDAMVGALLHGDSRLALEYARELERTPGWAATRPAAGAAPGLSWQRARYWQGRAAQEAGHPAAAEYFADVIRAAPLSYYGLAASWRVDPSGYAQAVQREVGAVLAREAEAAVTSCDLLDCGELLAAHWRQHGRVDPLRLPRERLAELPGAVLRAGFPLRFPVEVHAASAASGVPQSWLLAIGRRESHFRPTAVSPVGARGLMQLMPATARMYRLQLAAIGVELRGSLNDPATNLQLAGAMLAELNAAHGGSLEQIAAAYCTGPSRVAAWKRTFGATDADLWVEVVPYRAVRDYMREVTAAAAVYAVRMGEEPPAAGARLREPVPAQPR